MRRTRSVLSLSNCGYETKLFDRKQIWTHTILQINNDLMYQYVFINLEQVRKRTTRTLLVSSMLQIENVFQGLRLKPFEQRRFRALT